jgi:hypothetical protein
MKNTIISDVEGVNFVRPDALKEELIKTSLRVIKSSPNKNPENICPSYITQYYG